MAVFDPGRAFKGFPEAVRSFSTVECVNPTHLDPIHPQNHTFPPLFCFLFLPEIPTSAKLISTFLANGGSFEFFSLFHEIRHEELVSTNSGEVQGAQESQVMSKYVSKPCPEVVLGGWGKALISLKYILLCFRNLAFGMDV